MQCIIHQVSLLLKQISIWNTHQLLSNSPLSFCYAFEAKQKSQRSKFAPPVAGIQDGPHFFPLGIHALISFSPTFCQVVCVTNSTWQK